MAESSTERLTDSVVRSGVLGPEETPVFELLRSQFNDPDGLAREMVRRRWITGFQAERLLDGRAEEVVLGPYLLLDLLGEGGMGRVYKARHRLMNRLVALKVIRSDLLALGEARQRFLREIEAAARVWHPNLVTALDAAPIGDSFVLVMEYVEGITLARYLAQRGVPPIRHACEWTRQAALGLHHAHEQGLIHRDVKPSNLLLTHDERLIKVLDLGLARLELADDVGAENDPITASGVVIGTPDYLAPEQALAPRSADARSDIYSLGCTLYHLLTGRPPFPGGSFTQKLLWHQQSEPADPARLRASIPIGLIALTRRMMAKSPDQRFASAGEVAEALEPFRSAAAHKTLVPMEELPPSDSAIAPTPSKPVPIVHHHPTDSGSYEVVDDGEATPEREPEPEESSLPRPATEADESWWREDPSPVAPLSTSSARERVQKSEPDPSRPDATGRRVVVTVALASIASLAGLAWWLAR